jgi:hypothetical protein
VLDDDAGGAGLEDEDGGVGDPPSGVSACVPLLDFLGLIVPCFAFFPLVRVIVLALIGATSDAITINKATAAVASITRALFPRMAPLFAVASWSIVPQLDAAVGRSALVMRPGLCGSGLSSATVVHSTLLRRLPSHTRRRGHSGVKYWKIRVLAGLLVKQNDAELRL